MREISTKGIKWSSGLDLLGNKQAAPGLCSGHTEVYCLFFFMMLIGLSVEECKGLGPWENDRQG